MDLPSPSQRVLSKHSDPFTAWSPGFFPIIEPPLLSFRSRASATWEDSFFTFPVPDCWSVTHSPKFQGPSLPFAQWANELFSCFPPYELFKSRYHIAFLSEYPASVTAWLYSCEDRGHTFAKCLCQAVSEACIRRHHSRAIENRAFAIRQETIEWPSLTYIFLIVKMVT